MRKTHKDLLEWLGLKVGDEIKFSDSPNKWIVVNEEFIALDPKVDRYIDGVFKRVDQIPTKDLIEMEFNILQKPKKVGNLKCDDILGCDKCPLQYICNINDWGLTINDSLFDILELFKCDDQEIYNLLKARLDKEVLEDEEKD